MKMRARSSARTIKGFKTVDYHKKIKIMSSSAARPQFSNPCRGAEASRRSLHSRPREGSEFKPATRIFYPIKLWIKKWRLRGLFFRRRHEGRRTEIKPVPEFSDFLLLFSGHPYGWKIKIWHEAKPPL